MLHCAWLLSAALLVLSGSAAAQTDPTEAILQQAIAQHQAGNLDAAIAGYKKYLGARPESPLALSNYGAALARAGRYEDAILQYRHALKLQPGNLGVELNLGLAYYKTNQAEKAAGILERVHRAAPSELQPVLLLADCWLALGQEKRVIGLLRPFAAARPDDLAVAYQLGTALLRAKQLEEGQRIIDRLLRNGDSAEARLLLGTAKFAAQEYPAALADFRMAVDLNSDLPNALTYYGQALERTGDPVGAAEAYRKALARNPNDYTANLQLGLLLKDDQQNEDAFARFRHALEVRPGDLNARYQIAAMDLAGGRLEAARRSLEAVLKDAPEFTAAHVTLATVYYRLKRTADGDRENAIVLKLNAATQRKQQQGLNVK